MLVLGLAGLVVMADNWVVSPLLPSIAGALGTIATELAAQHRGVAMSLVAFAFMGGGSVGTMLAGRVIAARSFEAYLVVWGLGLVALAGVSSLILSRGTEEQRARAVGSARAIAPEAAPESV